MNSPTQDTYGVSRTMPQLDNIDEIICELNINGFAIVDSGINNNTLDLYRNKLDEIYAHQLLDIEDGELALKKINDTDIVRAVLTYDHEFYILATNSVLFKICERYLGLEFLLLQQNGIINRAKKSNYQIKWHRDLSFQHFTTSRPIALNALLCLNEFTAENGATFVLPATHKNEKFPTNIFCEKFGKQILAPKGSFIILDSMLYHRAGMNISNLDRYAINHVIGLPFMAQQIDISNVMREKNLWQLIDSKFYSYLGNRWSPAKNVSEWRNRRIRK